MTISGANPTITNSTFTHNKGSAVYYLTPPAGFGQLNGLVATSNDQNAVGLGAGTVSSALSWSSASVGIPLEMEGSLTVGATGTLTIAAGSTVEVASGYAIVVNGFGTLNMAGTARQPGGLHLRHRTGTGGVGRHRVRAGQ